MKKIRHRSKLYKRRKYKLKKQKKRKEEWEKFLSIIPDLLVRGNGSV